MVRPAAHRPPLPAAEAAQFPRYLAILDLLARARISRRNLYEAWDFTVASSQSLTGRLLAIRDRHSRSWATVIWAPAG